MGDQTREVKIGSTKGAKSGGGRGGRGGKDLIS